MSRRLFRFWFVLIPYILLLYISLWLAISFRYDNTLDAQTLAVHFKAFSIIFLFWLVVYFIHGLFEVQTLRRYSTLLFNLVSATVVNLLVAITYFYFQPNLILTPRRFLLILVGVSFVLLLLWNLLIKLLVKNSITESLYLFSFNNELAELEQEINSHSYLGYKVLGHLNENDLAKAGFARNAGIILPDNIGNYPEILSKFYQLRTSGIKFYNHKDFYEQLLRRIYLSQITEVWFLENINYREKIFYTLAKRVVDIVVGLVGFIIFLVTFPLIALAIKLSSKGPVFFIQGRVGKNGEIFRVYKYRSMATGTVTNTWTSVNDPRITGIGKFLRKSRVDEWPQFINLVLGHISLVGPRPEQPNIVETLKKQIPFYDERHLVKPGLTGWAQINNIYAANVEETKLKLQYDLYYIKNRDVLFDLEIILKTVYYIFTWQGR